jgi:uncharacterized OsmC-like protein
MSEGTMQVEVQWLDGKRIEVSARGNRLIVDEIYADGRQGMGFRPTELLLGALGACTMGTLLTFCKNMNIPVESFVIDVEGKRETGPERVSDIRISLRLAGDIPENRLETLRRVASGCRIHHTLTHPPSIGIELEVGERPV